VLHPAAALDTILKGDLACAADPITITISIAPFNLP